MGCAVSNRAIGSSFRLRLCRRSAEEPGLYVVIMTADARKRIVREGKTYQIEGQNWKAHRECGISL